MPLVVCIGLLFGWMGTVKMNKKLAIASGITSLALLTLACSCNLCGTSFETTPREEAVATGIAVSQAISTVEAQMQPTIAAACTASPEVASTAIAEATRMAPTARAVSAAVTPDPLFSPIGAYEPDQAMAYFEAVVLGIEPEKSYVTNVGFPDFVQAEIDRGLNWINESYRDVFVNGRGQLGLGLRQGDRVLGDDINKASLGAFVFRSEDALPADSDSALALIREVYPGLDAEFSSLTNGPDTFDFESISMLPAIVAGKPTLVPQFVYTGVTHNKQGQVVVWVVVARGVLAEIISSKLS